MCIYVCVHTCASAWWSSTCLHVCVCMYERMRIYVCVYTYVCIRAQARGGPAHAYMYIYRQIGYWRNTDVSLCTYVYIYICPYRCTHIPLMHFRLGEYYMHIYIYIYIYIYIHIYICNSVHLSLSFSQPGAPQIHESDARAAIAYDTSSDGC